MLSTLPFYRQQQSRTILLGSFLEQLDGQLIQRQPIKIHSNLQDMTFNISHVTQSCQKTWKKDSSLRIKKSHRCHIKQTVFDTTIITDHQHAFHPSIINFCFPADAGVRSACLVATLCTILSMRVDTPVFYHTLLTAPDNPSGYGRPLFM